MDDKTLTYIFNDILEKVLQLSENPRQFAEFLSQQIRELIGVRTVLITKLNEINQPEIFAVYPTRRTHWGNQPIMLKLAAISCNFSEAQVLSAGSKNMELNEILEELNVEIIIVIPLIAAQKRVGSILLVDIMDVFGIEAVMQLLNRLSGVFALVIRNSILYFNLESLVEERTSELNKRNRKLQESEHELKLLNQELNINNKRIIEINTQLEEAKEAAEKNETKFRNIFENVQDTFCETGIDGAILEISPSVEMLARGQYKREELIGVMMQDLYEVAEERQSLLSKLGEQGYVTDYEVNLKNKDGSIIPCSISAKIQMNMQGQPEKIIGSVRDITERKKAEEVILENQRQLLKAKEKAEESDRLKTAFLQNMSHEIRTPMNAIMGFSGMLNKANLSNEKRNSFVSIIQNSSNQLLSIVSDILTVSSIETKQEKVTLEMVCINNIMVDLLAMFKSQAKNQNISLYAKKELTDPQSEIFTDKTKVTQILSNLISNAAKFTHKGFIEFGYRLKPSLVKPHETEHEVTDQSVLSGVDVSRSAEMVFYVKDTGMGINKELHEKIFERFRQADISINKKYGGTGLGLSISKSFVELLGGKIWVESEPDMGSTFYFTIPYKPVHENLSLQNKQLNNKQTIVVAEDEEFNYLLIEELLIDMELKLVHVKNGQEAVDICRTLPNIALVIMDIKMPVMDGYTAAKLIKKFRPDLPIIAQSAYALEHEIEMYNDVFEDYIPKPIHEETLKQRVKRYITPLVQ